MRTPLRLQIELWTETASQSMAISYGADGLGPPDEIVRLVLRAREWSDPWYRQAVSTEDRPERA